MDYSRQPLKFKIKKALRYVRLYGVKRTQIKAKADAHMRRTYDPLPTMSGVASRKKHVGLLGCGKFGYGVIAYYLRKNHGDVLRGVMDVDIQHAASLASDFNAPYYTDDPGRVIGDPEIDLVYVASNHSSHAEYAISALEQGKHVHIEKPPVVSEIQLERLVEAMRRSRGRVTLGYNRPHSRLSREMKNLLQTEQGPMMQNWFVVGHLIEEGHWYYNPEEGGRVLGNFCHWIDLVLQLMPPASRYPIRISPARTDPALDDLSVMYTFGDGSMASINFSVKGYTFEGIRERCNVHRGDLLLAMDDFQRLVVDRGADRRVIRSFYRDQGHEANILSSYALSKGAPGLSVEEVWQTAELMLKTKIALEEGREVTIESATPRLIEHVSL